MALYTVKQHRPAYFEGFDDMVVTAVPEADFTNPKVLPWLKNFMHDDVEDYAFVEFYVEDGFGTEKLISARYNNGKHWVAAIARPEK